MPDIFFNECPKCGSKNVEELERTFESGTVLLYNWCNDCEWCNVG